MPFYTYKCPKGHSKELNHSILVDPEPNCEKCKERMKRVPKTVTVTFKGSGFASNDK
jgi:putative FmdB family regulatory protein